MRAIELNNAFYPVFVRFGLIIKFVKKLDYQEFCMFCIRVTKIGSFRDGKKQKKIRDVKSESLFDRYSFLTSLEYVFVLFVYFCLFNFYTSDQKKKNVSDQYTHTQTNGKTINDTNDILTVLLPLSRCFSGSLFE